MTLIPGIKQISQVGNDMYIQGAFPVGIASTEVDYLADPADTRLLAGRDPVIEEVSVGMSGVETDIKTASGAAPLQITDAMKGILRFLETNINLVQDLHGYANPWPAGGGKNLYNIDNQTSTPGNTFIEIDVLQNTDYTFSVDVTQTGLYIAYYDGSNWVDIARKYTATFISFNSGENTKIKITTYSNTNTLPTKFQLELGNTATSWEPYANICPITGWTGCNVYVSPTTNPADATVYPCTWQDEAGTVYGGTVDLVSGIGSLTWAMVGGSSWEQFNANNGYKAYRIFDAPRCKHTSLTNGEQLSDVIGEFGPFNSGSMNKNIIQPPLQSTTVYMALNENVDPSTVHLCYLILTPITFTFPGNQILTQKGTNYIWTDCGDTITAAYVAVK